MRNRAFSLVEILIIVVIIGILATLGFPAYQNTIEDSRKKVCSTNQRALESALAIYVMEHDKLPGNLSQLAPEPLRKAYAAILREKGAWKIKLAYYIVGWQERGLVYAGLLSDIAGGDIRLLTCPADPTPPSQGGRSYGMNSVLKDMTRQRYENLPAGTVLIGDCDHDEFSDTSALDTRHKKYSVMNVSRYAIGIDRGHKIHEVKDKNKSTATQKGGNP